MADIATPSSATGASTPVNKGEKKNAVEKPERPDQAQYEKEVAEADKKVQAAVERQVNHKTQSPIHFIVSLISPNINHRDRKRSRRSSILDQTTRTRPHPSAVPSSSPN